MSINSRVEEVGSTSTVSGSKKGLRVFLSLIMLSFLFISISVISEVVLNTILTFFGIIAGYFITKPIQSEMLLLSQIIGQFFIVIPLMLIITFWLYLFVKFNLMAGFNTTFPVYLFIVFTAYWPLLFRFSSKLLGKRMFEYSSVYSFVGMSTFSIIMVLNYVK